MTTDQTRLPPVQLNQHFAMLDPLSGKWNTVQDTSKGFEKRGRASDTVQKVYARIGQLEGVTLSDYGLFCVSRSLSHLEAYQKDVVAVGRMEVAEHIRYVHAIGEKVKERHEASWQWFINLPIIGYLFSLIASQAKVVFTSNLKALTLTLVNRYNVLCALEDKLETAKHIAKLLKEDKLVKRAFHEYDKYKAEDTLYDMRRRYPEVQRTIFVVRRDPENIEGFIVSQLDTKDTRSKVVHLPITARRINDTAYMYIRPQNPEFPQAGMATMDSLKALHSYLHNLQKKED